MGSSAFISSSVKFFIGTLDQCDPGQGLLGHLHVSGVDENALDAYRAAALRAASR